MEIFEAMELQLLVMVEVRGVRGSDTCSEVSGLVHQNASWFRTQSRAYRHVKIKEANA